MIKFYKSFLILICFFIFGIGALFISFIIFPLITCFMSAQNKKFAYANVIHNTWKFFINLLQKIGIIKINFSNKKLLSNLSGKVIVASHPTFIDIVILIGTIPNSTCLAKKETLKNPFFKNIVKSIYIINDTELEKFKSETDKFLKAGFNIIIFPSGTRTVDIENIKLHKGSAVIALNSNAGVIPVKITTDYPFLQKHGSICDIGKRPVTYNIEVKDEIYPQNYANLGDIKARKEIMELIKKEI